MSDDPANVPDIFDDELEALLNGALTPVTDAHVATAQAAFAWRDVDAALTTLVETHRAEPLLRSSALDAGRSQRLTYQLTLGEGQTTTVVIDLEQVSASRVNAVALIDAIPEITVCAIRDREGQRRAVEVVDAMAVLDGLSVSGIARFEFEIDGRVVAVSPWMTL